MELPLIWSRPALAVKAMVVLWLIATIHHRYFATADSAPSRESAPSPRPAGVG